MNFNKIIYKKKRISWLGAATHLFYFRRKEQGTRNRRTCCASKHKAHVSNNLCWIWDELQLEATRKWLREPGLSLCRLYLTRTRRSIVICWRWMFLQNMAGVLPEHKGENYCVNIFYLHSNNCIAVIFFFPPDKRCWSVNFIEITLTKKEKKKKKELRGVVLLPVWLSWKDTSTFLNRFNISIQRTQRWTRCGEKRGACVSNNLC